MTVKLGFSDVILNEGKPSKKMLVIINENGTLLVDNELFSISFEPNQNLDIDIKNYKEIKYEYF